MIKAAIEVRMLSYSPYSHFKVGAAIRSPDGRVFAGCNIESCTYTPSVCAERSAISVALSAGCREFIEIAVVADLPDQFVTPCGVCRQMITEFETSEGIKIYMARSEPDQVLISTISDLLPRSFKPNYLSEFHNKYNCTK